MQFAFSIRPERARRFLVGITLFLSFVDLLVKIIHWKFGSERVFGLVHFLNLGREMSFPTWYSSTQLALAGFVLAYIAWRHVQARHRNAIAWCILTAGFFLMSADETTAMHERWYMFVPEGVSHRGILYNQWVVVAIPLVLVLLVFFWRLLASMSARTRYGMLVAGAIFLMGAVGMEMFEGYLVSARLIANPGFAYDVLNMIENGGELLGIALFIPELLRYIELEMPRTVTVSGQSAQ